MFKTFLEGMRGNCLCKTLVGAIRASAGIVGRLCGRAILHSGKGDWLSMEGYVIALAMAKLTSGQSCATGLKGWLFLHV
jgi:hypothetical protein